VIELSFAIELIFTLALAGALPLVAMILWPKGFFWVVAQYLTIVSRSAGARGAAESEMQEVLGGMQARYSDAREDGRSHYQACTISLWDFRTELVPWRVLAVARFAAASSTRGQTSRYRLLANSLLVTGLSMFTVGVVGSVVSDLRIVVAAVIAELLATSGLWFLNRWQFGKRRT